MTDSRNVALLVLALTLASCGGGGDGAASPGVQPSEDSVPSNSPVYPLTEVNGSLSGTIWIPGDGAIYTIETGEYRTLSTNRTYPSRDGQEYLETVV